MTAPAPRSIVPMVVGLPGLNTRDPALDLPETEIPEGRGFDLTVDGTITKGTIPSGSARIEKTIELDIVDGETVDDVPFLNHYRRLFNITGRTASGTSNVLHIGAIDILDSFFYQPRLHPLPFDEDAQPILAIVPYGTDDLMVAKSTGSTSLGNFTDTRGFFTRSPFMEDLVVPAANQITALNGIIYVANTDGLFAHQRGQTTHASAKIKDTSLTSKALTLDHELGYVILGATHVYDTINDKWFQYSTSAFSFKTRVLRQPEYTPFAVDRLLFAVERTDTNDAEIVFNVKYEDEDFTTEDFTVDAISDTNQYTMISHSLQDNRSVRKFQIEVKSMDSNIRLYGIWADIENFQQDDYSS